MAASVSRGKIEVFGVKQAFSADCHTQQSARMHRAPLTHPAEPSETEIYGHSQSAEDVHQLLPDKISWRTTEKKSDNTAQNCDSFNLLKKTRSRNQAYLPMTPILRGVTSMLESRRSEPSAFISYGFSQQSQSQLLLVKLPHVFGELESCRHLQPSTVAAEQEILYFVSLHHRKRIQLMTLKQLEGDDVVRSNCHAMKTLDTDFFPFFCTEVVLGDSVLQLSCFCFYPQSLAVCLLKTIKYRSKTLPVSAC